MSFLRVKKLFMILAALLFSAGLSFAAEVWNGVVHITDPESLEHDIINLNGNWEFYPAQEFQSFNREQYDMAFIKVPGAWEYNVKKNLQADFACYRIKIMGLKPGTRYAIFSRVCPATASKFFCNGAKVGEYGRYSSNEKLAKSAERPVYLFLNSDSIGTIELVIQVSSFSNHQSGIISSLLFAEQKVITSHFIKIIISCAILLGAILFTCIINFSVFIGDTKNFANMIFGFLLLGLLCQLLTSNGSILSWMFPDIPFSVIQGLKYVPLWMSPQLFSVLMMRDKSFEQHYPYVDKAIFGIFSAFAVIFCAFPIKYTNYLSVILISANGLFYFYAIIRMARNFAVKQIKDGIYLSFYIVVTTGFFFDILFPVQSSMIVILFSQVGILILVMFDVFYMAYAHQSIFHNTHRIMTILENINDSYEKFISHEFLELVNRSDPNEVKLGDYAKTALTIMYVQTSIITSDETTILPRHEFDTCSKFIKLITDCIDQSNGFVSNFLGRGCVAIFTGGPNDALFAARKIMVEADTLNETQMRSGEYCVSINAGIHYGDVITGAIGEDLRLDNVIIGPCMNAVCRISAVAYKHGGSFLISKDALDQIEGDIACDVRLYPNSIITAENDEIILYECVDENSSDDDTEVVKPVPISSKEIENFTKIYW
ncbi:MAG: hypothetical protein K6E69_06595 [Treponema sp.]|uniref:adenylate/guanylate cyclase domain-containing protein n=1 Tax=Treponema sp. TaxID=166 RepID=UPI00298E3CFA|nr:hypothetical protein [Treponema sp.]MCR5386771.1 hypothetical protein [Treponema sp.]